MSYPQQQSHVQAHVQAQIQPQQQQSLNNIYNGTDNFDNLTSLNLDNLNPSDFSIPSLSEFLDNPGASFPNLSGDDLTNSGYVQCVGNAHATMQFEPQMDGTFDPTSITDQSLDGSAGSNPTTPEKNKNTISPASTPQVAERPESSKRPPAPLKKYCEICGKEYEGKNKSMNKVQHMIHHFKDQLYQHLPPKSEDGQGLPYKCPEENCKFETKHKPDWARHYGSVHKVVDRLLKQYMDDNPDAWAHQPENKELLREQQPVQVTAAASSSSAARAQSVVSAGGSDHLDASEGLLCKLTDLQQKGAPNPALLPSSAQATAVQVTSLALKVSAGQPIIVSSPSQQGRLSVELPKSDLTKFITSALTEKNVPHATVSSPGPSTSGEMTEQQILEQKVQSVINEQQQILNNQKAQVSSVKTESTMSVSQPVMSNTIKQPQTISNFQLPQQPVPVPVPVSGAAGGSLQQLLQSSGGKNIIIRDPKTGQQLVVQTSQSGTGQHLLIQKGAGPGQAATQQLILQTKDGQKQIIQVQSQAKPADQPPSPAQPAPQHMIVQSSSGQQVVVNPSQLRLQQPKLVQVEPPQQSGRQSAPPPSPSPAPSPAPQPQPSTSQPQQVVLQSPQSVPPSPSPQAPQAPLASMGPAGTVQTAQQAQAGPSQQGQQIIQSKIVQHNGRTYLVQVRAQKPLEPGKQIVIKTNQPGIGGSGLVQEVMDEVIRQQYQKQSDQQKISELAMQLQQQTQPLLQGAQPQKATPVKGISPGIKLTQQQQQLLLPTEPHPQITAQHQLKQQRLLQEQGQQQQQQSKGTSILQQQLELPISQGVKTGAQTSTQSQKPKVNSPVQCFLCQEMPWFPNQEHLDNHYSSAHGIMKPTDACEELDNIPFSNADLEASLSSINDPGDAGDFESLLDALPPSPEPQDVQEQPLAEPVRRKSTNNQQNSNSRMCELCGFEPKTKNKSRERMDHLAMKHFREQMISELRKDKPMKCPRCDVFESKDRQQLFRHMISKHKVLDQYLADAIQKMRDEGKQTFGAAATPAPSTAVTASAPTETPGPSTSTSSEAPPPSPVTVSEDKMEPSTSSEVSDTVTPPESAEAAGIEENKKTENIMQVDGSDSCSGSELGDDDQILQLDGAGDEEDNESVSMSVDPGDDDSEFSVDDQRVKDKASKSICPLCKEEMKFSKTYHFATTHFRPRLQKELPTKKPFICPDCGEEQQHKINLWSHYIGRAHKHLEEWLE